MKFSELFRINWREIRSTVKCTTKSGKTHFNYLKYYSLGLQGVTDAGSESDGGIFHSSTLYNLFETNRLNVAPDQPLSNSNIVIPNVEVYPLKTYLIRSYPQSRNWTLDDGMQLFKDHLSRARKCIKNEFGILHQKIRNFLYL